MIRTPNDPALAELCRALAAAAGATDQAGTWPQAQLDLLARAGVYGWFVPEEFGGQGWGPVDVLRGYVRLSEACLCTSFILTQWVAACRRIVTSANDRLKSELLGPLAQGDLFATVGISHLTTSRQHLARPVLRATETAGGFRLDGYSPWVTGGGEADVLVTGGTLEDGRQILAAVPTPWGKLAWRCPQGPGRIGDSIHAGPASRLVALTASQTGPVHFEQAYVSGEWLLDGPVEHVMGRGSGGGTGGLPTSAVAVGLAGAALAFLETQTSRRADLRAPVARLRREHERLAHDLDALGEGRSASSLADLRARANSLVLRASQAALAAAKGAGYVDEHPAGRWCREALFFLVWSCPQEVLDANLCELAGHAE